MKYVNDQFFSMDGVVDERTLSADIYSVLMPHIKNAVAKKTESIVKAMKLQCYCSSFDIKTDEIHLLNGVLKTDGSWCPEKRFCINRINVKYTPSAVPECGRFLTFLREMLDDEDILTLQEYMGYCLIPTNIGQKAMFIVGNGGEGKSCIGGVLKSIFGESMVSGTFQALETERFARVKLQNKLLMADDDMQMNALPSTGIIKNLITSQIPVEIESKGQQSKQVPIYCRFICFGNGSPRALYDKSDGFIRRLLILTTKPVPKNRIPDPSITEKLIEEKEGIFCWMFRGLQRLIANNFSFTVSQKAQKNMTELASENCNISDFLADESYIRFGAGIEATSNDLYGAYFQWCSINGLTPLKHETLTGWLKANSTKYGIKYDCNIRSRENRRVRGFKGIQTSYTPIIT